MKKEELIDFGNEAIRKALKDMFVILNGKNEILTRLDGDRMEFSPRLECDSAKSTITFDSEDGAKRTIEEILIPQEDGDYKIYRFTEINDDGDSDDENDKDDEDFEFDFSDESDGDFEDDGVDESISKCPTMREAQKIFKKNGYQLVSQKGSHQKWVKDGDPIPIILPYHSRDNEQIRPGDWKSIIKEHNLNLNV